MVGIDGRKMSKSYGNAIELGEGAETTTKKVMGAVTDPARKLPQGPGQPRGLRHLLPAQDLQRPRRPWPGWTQNCRTAGIGCVDCKKKLLERLGARPGAAARAARDAARAARATSTTWSSSAPRKARAEAERTMEQVRAAMKL